MYHQCVYTGVGNEYDAYLLDAGVHGVPGLDEEDDPPRLLEGLDERPKFRT